jgi:hypothetical protein
MKAGFHQAPCPLLPEVAGPVDPLAARVFAESKCGHFYAASLCLAQSYWRQAKPAQAILQLNKAFMADLRGDEEVLQSWPAPYGVLVWMLHHRPPQAFVGNPVRHFQHLATRVSGQRREIRSWRAWGCFHLARRVLPADGFPPDEVQIERERLEIPAWERVSQAIRHGGWRGEGEQLHRVAALL